MKVIMLKDVGGVGQRGTIIQVKDGYALNFLIPHGSAVQATPEKIAAHEAKQKQDASLKEKQVETLKIAVQSLEGARITVKARATEKGGLFKSLVVADIAKAILDQKNIHIPETVIVLEKPLKQIGEHMLKLRAGGAESTIVFEIQSV